MGYPDGVQKIVTFGCGLKMDGKYPGVWCYKVHREENQCTYEGVPMTWEQWGQEVAKTIDLCRTHEAMRLFGLELQAYLKRNPKLLDGFMSALYYSDHKYMTLPLAEKEQLERWVYQYVKISCQEFWDYLPNLATKPPLLFPLHGDTGSDEYSFTNISHLCISFICRERPFQTNLQAYISKEPVPITGQIWQQSWQVMCFLAAF